MPRASLSLKNLPYDDSALHLELVASNGSQATTQDFYCYANDLREFARALQHFPAHLSQEVSFEIGAKDPGVAHHVLIRAYVFDGVGHSAIEVGASDSASEPNGHSTQFHIRCDPAAINRLGQRLAEWVDDLAEPLSWRPEA